MSHSAHFVLQLSGNGDIMEYRLQTLLHEQHLSRVDTPTPQPANAPWKTRDYTITNLQDFFTKKNATFIPRYMRKTSKDNNTM